MCPENVKNPHLWCNIMLGCVSNSREFYHFTLRSHTDSFCIGPSGNQWVVKKGKVVVTFTDQYSTCILCDYMLFFFFGLITCKQTPVAAFSFFFSHSGLVSFSVSPTTTSKRPSVVLRSTWCHTLLGVIPCGGTSRRSGSHRQCFKYLCGWQAQRCEEYFLPQSEGADLWNQHGTTWPCFQTTPLFSVAQDTTPVGAQDLDFVSAFAVWFDN